MTKSRRALNGPMALIAPFVIQTIFLTIIYATNWNPFELKGLELTKMISVVAGFVFLVRAFSYYSILLGIIYIPAMYLSLVPLSLAFESGTSWRTFLSSVALISR
jgi:hypothetical protein